MYNRLNFEPESENIIQNISQSTTRRVELKSANFVRQINCMRENSDFSPVPGLSSQPACASSGTIWSFIINKYEPERPQRRQRRNGSSAYFPYSGRRRSLVGGVRITVQRLGVVPRQEMVRKPLPLPLRTCELRTGNSVPSDGLITDHFFACAGV